MDCMYCGAPSNTGNCGCQPADRYYVEPHPFFKAHWIVLDRKIVVDCDGETACDVAAFATENEADAHAARLNKGIK